jgi:hypothetical protein|tara:strand:- start:617 stop:1114 length:498 start_codon:yes stop_codon:yes gene_type:complete
MKSLFDEYDDEEVYNAFKFAETGSFDNPWIRTVARDTDGGSTAFGPVQITGGLIDNFYDNEREVFNDNSDIAETLKGQSTLFNWFGNESGKAGFDKKYDYGGEGVGLTDTEKVRYKDFAQDMMSDMWSKNKNKENPILSFIQSWRGKSIEEDPDYYKRFNSYLGR